jgi:cellulose synthase/poly-beta-1,6-N-acetylglucosamine synthase-like glycosyltransferase
MERKYVSSIGMPLRIINNLVSDKPKLVIVVSVIVVSVLAIPLIIPYISHTQHIYHIILHIASLILAIFLCIVSFSSYFRNGGSRLLFMSLGFISLILVEVLFLFYAARGVQDILIPVINIELPHIILFAMLALFGIGIVKVNSR